MFLSPPLPFLTHDVPMQHARSLSNLNTLNYSQLYVSRSPNQKLSFLLLAGRKGVRKLTRDSGARPVGRVREGTTGP